MSDICEHDPTQSIAGQEEAWPDSHLNAATATCRAMTGKWGH